MVEDTETPDQGMNTWGQREPFSIVYDGRLETVDMVKTDLAGVRMLR